MLIYVIAILNLGIKLLNRDKSFKNYKPELTHVA